jgi:hypothetical protein
MAALVEGGAKPPAGDALLTHEATHTGQAGDQTRGGGAAMVNAMLLDGNGPHVGGTTRADSTITVHGDHSAPPLDEPTSPKVDEINVTKPADGATSDKDVRMKSSKIKEN